MTNGAFTDPGADTWTATVDYGDGSGAQPLPLNPDKTFNLSHFYADNGTFTVTVTVTDDDGAAGSQAVTLAVHRAGLVQAVDVPPGAGVVDVYVGTGPAR